MKIRRGFILSKICQAGLVQQHK